MEDKNHPIGLRNMFVAVKSGCLPTTSNSRIFYSMAEAKKEAEIFVNKEGCEVHLFEFVYRGTCFPAKPPVEWIMKE
jgi:hypothetical protein